MTTSRRLLALVGALLLPLLAVTTEAAADPADAGPLFTPLAGHHPAAGAIARSPAKAYRVDLAGLRDQLAGGGRETLVLPDPSGEQVTFHVVDSPILDPAGQAAYPQIRTYAGRGEDGSTIRLSVTPLGLAATVRRPDGTAWYLDPMRPRTGEDRVVSHLGGTVPRAPAFEERNPTHAGSAPATDRSAPGPGQSVTRRTYRLALLNDPPYAHYFGDSDVNVLAAKAELINRVNEVYTNDLAVQFQLVSSPALNLGTDAEATGPDGPCGADPCFDASQLGSCDVATLDRSDFVLGQLVGADSFDIGHLVLGVDGGGIAGLGVVGGPLKAEGCTGLPEPTGDSYAIDYVAHEMGHQMGADHTFNGVDGACAGNGNPATAVEPGSGSSVMAYAGICSSDNLQPHSDPYFSFKSVDEVEATTAAGRSDLQERQSVTFSGLSNGEQLTINCTGCTSRNVVFTGTPATDAANIDSAITAATGSAVAVTGYDGDPFPTANGFTVDFADTADHPPLSVTGPFTSSAGTLVQGGPQGNGGATTATSDHSPVVTAPADKTIPKQTPFTLTGSATDADADVLHYLWEQTDSGTGTSLVSNSKPNGPLFRVFGTPAQVSGPSSLLYHSPGENVAGTEPSRTFPDLTQILAGTTNAATGACPAAGPAPVAQSIVDCYSEFLPTSARSMHFRLTARDGRAGGGGVSWDDVALTVDPTAGPFLVTSRASGGVASGVERVTWAVAHTDTAALAKNVRITLSTDGGLTYPVVLAASTPNDGSEAVLLPNISTTTARIKVEAVGNYFFDLNDANFSVVPAGHFAHGKGTFTSPKGSSTRFVGAKGKAKLAFLGESGASPNGAATFTFKNGKIRFAGDTVVSSRIKGRTFRMKVTGSNRHKAHYTLVITAVDKGSRDKVRVRLLRRTTLVYDSMPGTKASARPQTRIKGSITVS